MLRYLLILMVLLKMTPHPLCAQEKEALPLVSMEMSDVSLQVVMAELERQTGMFFSYDSSLFNEIHNVSFSAHEESFSYSLKRLFSNLPIVYRITGRIVILKRKPLQYTISGFVRDSVSYKNLIKAAVTDSVYGKEVETNSFGFYSLTLPAGKVHLKARFSGFNSEETTFVLTRDTLLDFPLGAIDYSDRYLTNTK